jgi:hypothetical protein
MRPQLGDIWCDDSGQCVLFVSEPNYISDDEGIAATVIFLNNGKTRLRYFDVDPDTGTLYNWWTKVA